MMEMISRHFSKMLGVVAVLLLVVGTIAGGVFAAELVRTQENNYWLWAISFLIGATISFFLTYVFVVMVFGFMAQILSINEKLSRIEKLVDSIDDCVG